MVSVPPGKLDVLAENWPPTKVPEPITVVPLLMVTVPVGGVPLGTLVANVAVNMTDCPRAEGLDDETKVIAVPRAFSSTLTVLLPPLAVAKSGALSPLKSPTTAEWDKYPAPKICGCLKVPSPLPRSKLTRFPGLRPRGMLVTARSSKPSPLKSAATMEEGFAPAGYSLGAWNVPSPLPSRMVTCWL